MFCGAAEVIQGTVGAATATVARTEVAITEVFISDWVTMVVPAVFYISQLRGTCWSTSIWKVGDYTLGGECCSLTVSGSPIGSLQDSGKKPFGYIWFATRAQENSSKNVAI